MTPLKFHERNADDTQLIQYLRQNSLPDNRTSVHIGQAAFDIRDKQVQNFLDALTLRFRVFRILRGECGLFLSVQVGFRFTVQGSRNRSIPGCQHLQCHGHSEHCNCGALPRKTPANNGLFLSQRRAF